MMMMTVTMMTARVMVRVAAGAARRGSCPVQSLGHAFTSFSLAGSVREP